MPQWLLHSTGILCTVRLKFSPLAERGVVNNALRVIDTDATHHAGRVTDCISTDLTYAGRVQIVNQQTFWTFSAAACVVGKLYYLVVTQVMPSRLIASSQGARKGYQREHSKIKVLR